MSAILEVIKYPDALLKQRSIEVTEVTEEIRTLALNMIETMIKECGIGIAAPQVGVLKRVIVVMVKQSTSHPSVPLVMINPVITDTIGTQKGGEGCLSFPGVFEQVERPEQVSGTYMDLEGEIKTFITTGLEARCIDHEVDHLDGRLFVELMSTVRRQMVAKSMRRLVG